MAYGDAQLTVVELGAGTGVVGLELAGKARREDWVVLTDLPEVCPLLEENAGRVGTGTAGASVHVQALSWGSSEHARELALLLGKGGDGAGTRGRELTHIVCSDLVRKLRGTDIWDIHTD